MILFDCSFRAIFVCQLLLSFFYSIQCFSEQERISLRDEAREMFIHAYDSYMKHAYPADELMPLSCKGRFRDTELNRGDVDDALGNFSLTLIDSVDTLVILGNYSEFENAVFHIINDVKFDSDIVVSVFETNIRVVGGLLSAHVLAQYVQKTHGYLLWYQNELLDMAKDIGYRLLPAFDSPTGIPHPRINLKYGLNSPKIGSLKETCTSCAGTMILEFAALSRLTGDFIFETKARIAMDYLWNQRHRQSNLVGNVINFYTGDWIRKESGVGAGIDSYYEYCLKAYVLLGDDNYLHRFNCHYAGVMKYVSQGPLLIDVHMHRPHSQAKNFMDSLLAFWPGLQVLKGDLKPAIETHEVLYQITQRHSFLPEAFTTDFNIYWPHYPLRPEFLESTYFLYQATGDDYYLEVGKDILLSLQNHTRVHCGFAAVNDVRTKKKEDRMDSFVLAETLKYLFLLFSKKSEIDLNLDQYVFTTEAHLLPLTLAAMNNTYKSSNFNRKNSFFSSGSDYHCPANNALNSFNTVKINDLSYYNNIRRNVKDYATKLKNAPMQSKSRHYPRIKAADFSAMKPEHVNLVKQLGISVVILNDGRVQLVHNSGSAKSQEDAEEGALFMQEMISLSKQYMLEEQKLRTVSFSLPGTLHSDEVKIKLLAGPAQFGPDLSTLDEPINGALVKANPIDACVVEKIKNKNQLNGKIVLVERGNCMFIEKARNIQLHGAIGLVVYDNVQNSSSKTMPMFAMSSDGFNDVTLPSVFLYSEDSKILINAIEEYPSINVQLGIQLDDEINSAQTIDSNVIHKFFKTIESKQKQTNTDPNESVDYLSDLNNIFNAFKSNKLKFDLLNSLNLKNFKDENINFFTSIINKLALSSEDKKESLNNISNDYGLKSNIRVSSGHCLNPYIKSKHFLNYLLSLFSICTA